MVSRSSFGHALHFQPERDIAERGAPREQLGEILEHHAAVHAVAGDRLAADADFAEAGARNPAIMLSKVDLPQPDGPTMQRNSEASILKLTSLTPAPGRRACRR